MQLDDKDKDDWIFGEDGPNSTPPDDSADTASATPPAAAAAPDTADVVKNYIAQKYAQQIADAKSAYKPTSDTSKVIQGIGSILKGSDPAATVDAIDAADEVKRKRLLAPVDEEMNQDQKIQTLATDDQKFQRTQKQQQIADDPNSATSANARLLAKKLDPTGKYDGMSASQVEEILPKLKDIYGINEKSKDRALQYATIASTKADKVKTTANAKQNEAYTKMRHDLETFRGNQAAQQAAVSVMNSNKALDLVNLYDDPNKLSPEQVQLIAAETAKVATGGLPTESGTKDLVTPTLKKKAAEISQFLFNHPSGAEAGEFIKRNKSYLNEMKKTSQNVINDYRNNIAKGYKDRVSPEQYAEAQGDYSLGMTDPKTTGDTPAQPVRMQDPQGNIRLVSADQVEAAKAAGGTLVDGDDTKPKKLSAMDAARSNEGW